MHVNKYAIYIYIYIYVCVNLIKYTNLYAPKMSRTILQIYIEQTMHPTTVQNIYNYISNYVYSKIFKYTNECFRASPRIRRIDI